MFKRFLVRFGLWLARKGGYDAHNQGVASDIIDSAKLISEQAEAMKGVSGEYKRREVLRSLMNRHPDANERDLNLAIELVLKWT